MNNINQIQQQDSPEVIFDNKKKILKISGNSYPENCEIIYEPINVFLDEYTINKSDKLNFEFRFNLINSTSTVYLAQIIMKIAQLHTDGLIVSILWYYDEFDEELLDLGEKLSSISNLLFTFKPIKD
jgi:hypothetical protein